MRKYLNLLTKKDVAKEMLSFVFSITATAIGFFIALWINSYLERRRDYDTYLTQRKMIANEARVNKIIVDSSYMYYGVKHRGYIFAEMTLNSSEDVVKNLNFIHNMPDNDIQVLQSYIRYVKLLNTYKKEINSNHETSDYSYGENLEVAMKQKRDSLVRYINILTKKPND